MRVVSLTLTYTFSLSHTMFLLLLSLAFEKLVCQHVYLGSSLADDGIIQGADHPIPFIAQLEERQTVIDS